jgi:hypothetical protein
MTVLYKPFKKSKTNGKKTCNYGVSGISAEMLTENTMRYKNTNTRMIKIKKFLIPKVSLG